MSSSGAISKPKPISQSSMHVSSSAPVRPPGSSPSVSPQISSLPPSPYSPQSVQSLHTPSTLTSNSNPSESKKGFSLKNIFKSSTVYVPAQSQASLIPPSSSAFADMFPDLKNAPRALKPSGDDEEAPKHFTITVHSFTESKSIDVQPSSDGFMIRFEIYRAFNIPYSQLQQGNFTLFNSKHFGASATELTDLDLYDVCRQTHVPNLILIPAERKKSGSSKSSVENAPDSSLPGHISNLSTGINHIRAKPQLAPLTIGSPSPPQHAASTPLFRATPIKEQLPLIQRKIVETPTTSSPTSYGCDEEIPDPNQTKSTSENIFESIPTNSSPTSYDNFPQEPPLPPLPPAEIERQKSLPSPPQSVSHPPKKLLKRATRITNDLRFNSPTTSSPTTSQHTHQLRHTAKYENLKANIKVFGIRPSPRKIIDNLTQYFPEIVLVSDVEQDADEDDVITDLPTEKLHRPASANAVLMKRETVKLLREHSIRHQHQTLGRSFGRKVTRMTAVVNALNAVTLEKRVMTSVVSDSLERRKLGASSPLGSLERPPKRPLPTRLIFESPANTLSRLGKTVVTVADGDCDTDAIAYADGEDDTPADLEYENIEASEENLEDASVPTEPVFVISADEVLSDSEEYHKVPLADDFSDRSGAALWAIPRRLVSVDWKRKLSKLGASGGLFVSVDSSSGSDDSGAIGKAISETEQVGTILDEAASGVESDGESPHPKESEAVIDALLPPILSIGRRSRANSTWKGYRVVCESPSTDAIMDSHIPDTDHDTSTSQPSTPSNPSIDASTTIASVPDVLLSPTESIAESWGSPNHIAWTKGQMIGQGSFGKVYFGVNLTNQELMAVKQVQLVPLKVGAGPALVNRNKKLLDALHVEISLLQELNHQNVVNYLGFDVQENLVSVFLEYIDGGSLASILSRFGKFNYEMAQSFTCQILCGLEYLHERCIIHRDIKGANILVNHKGVVKIADFGISKKNDLKYQPNARLSLQGTVYWMAPEVMQSQGGYSAKVDIWSLGCVVYEMLEGHHPWAGYNEMQIMWKVGREHSAPMLTSGLREDVKVFLESCFETVPEKRPTATELLSWPFADVDPADFDFKNWLETAEAYRNSMVLDEDDSDDDSDAYSSSIDSDSE
ncbi:UNVERIFIED_CONTAM: hypothetical protein HDU68_001071 [Siphonaria sp. JEL0065]|nr:hypothetical protein HDU68_001071 [Siphonaria sp. JEL0065]